jgi:uncharacterized protein
MESKSKLDSALLDRMVARLVAEFHPEQIILFGSHAWGTPNPDSDIDLCVIISESDERPIKRMQRACKAIGIMGISSDILVKTRQEIDCFKDVISSFERQILTKGKVIYDGGKMHRHSKLAPEI